MPSEKQLGLLRDILDSANVIKTYLAEVTEEAFMQNTEKQDAVLRRFEIIGEASSRLTPETRDLFPSLPFRQMRGMRNIIAHDYGGSGFGPGLAYSQQQRFDFVDQLFGHLLLQYR